MTNPLRYLLGMAALAMAFACAAQNYPSKTVRFIVPFPAGGTTDVLGRVLANELSKNLGQNIIVDNRGGAGGRIGTVAAAQAAPDGYTFVVVADNFVIDPIVEKDLPYDTFKDFQPVSLVARAPLVLVSSNVLPVNDLKELASYAKANPGKVTFGSTGFGTSTALAGVLFQNLTGTEMLYVNYKAAVQGQTDIAGGILHLWYGSSAFGKQMQATGKAKILGQLGKTRIPMFPDVRTFGEQGIDLEVYGFIGLLTRSGTSPQIISRWQTEVTRAGRDAAFGAKVTELGWEKVMGSPGEFQTFLAAENARWAQVIKSTNISQQK